MKGIRVDPVSLTARAEPGLRWTEFDRETQAFGLATTGGTVGDTGIAGLTLGGGFGWLGGKFGMTVDNVLSMDVVLADGRLVTASTMENEDLFWALRGGGGNFGVVTSFEYRLHHVGPVIAGGLVMFPFEEARGVLRSYGRLLKTAPDELTVAAALMTGPDGNKACGIVAAYIGSLEEGEKALAEIRAFGKPVIDALGPIPYAGQQSLLEQGMPPNLHNYWKADFVSEVSDGVIDAALACFENVPSPLSVILWYPIHGAAARFPVESAAYPHRGGVHMGMYSLWNTGDVDSEKNVAWARDAWQRIQPFVEGGVYINELGEDEGEDRVRQAYGPSYPRLVDLKAKYDPANVFRFTSNLG
jgi:FAD/FMN-containing dehydrogenase